MFRTCGSPVDPLSIELSIPHRLLYLAVIRKALVGISTIDELFSATDLTIRTKEEFRDQPIFVAGGSRGLSVDRNEPMRSTAFCAYLSSRGWDAGFRLPLDFYSWRHGAAAKLAEVLGHGVARAILGHDFKSRKLEDFYIPDWTADTDCTAAALNDTATLSNTNSTKMYSLDPAYNRLSTSEVEKRDAAVQNIFKKLCDADESYPHHGNTDSKKEPNRLHTEAAKRIVTEQIARDQGIDGDNHQRKEEIRALLAGNTSLNRAIAFHLAKLAPTMATPATTAQGSTEQGQYGHVSPHDLTLSTRRGLKSSIPEEFEISHQFNSRTYAEIAMAFMKVLDGIGKDDSLLGRPPYGFVRCELCAEDPTIPRCDKDKLLSIHRIDAHRRSHRHTRKGRFGREAEAGKDEHGKDIYRCPICVNIADGQYEVTTFPTKESFFTHVSASSEEALVAGKRGTAWWAKLDEQPLREITAQHAAAKRRIGFDEEDFNGPAADRAIRSGPAVRRKLPPSSADFLERLQYHLGNRLNVIFTDFIATSKFKIQKQYSSNLKVGALAFKGRLHGEVETKEGIADRSGKLTAVFVQSLANNVNRTSRDYPRSRR